MLDGETQESPHPKVVWESLTYPNVACLGGIVQNDLLTVLRVCDNRAERTLRKATIGKMRGVSQMESRPVDPARIGDVWYGSKRPHGRLDCFNVRSRQLAVYSVI
jgi:hypothetical protein